MYGFEQEMISLAIGRSNALLLMVSQDKEMLILQHIKLIDVTVMTMLVPWCGETMGQW